MTLMLAEVLRFCAVSDALPESRWWSFLCSQQSHAAWAGCTLHDLIQPSFVFLVGVVLPFSLARRALSGQSPRQIFGHATVRSLALIGLGLFLTGIHPRRPVWSFIDTLVQIGLGYPVLFWLARYPPRTRWIAVAVILVGYWLAFALYPLPGPAFDYAQVGVSDQWLQRFGMTGFSAHWEKNSNLAWACDVWFLNLLPQPKPFWGQTNGLCTLNFVPQLGTMLLGLWAGEILRSDRSTTQKVQWLAGAGIVGLVSGQLLEWLGVCPIVKAIWTPSWVLFSGGWCLLLLALFHVSLDRRTTPLGQWLIFPFVVVGSNSIIAYAISHLFPTLAWNSVRRVTGPGIFRVFGDAYEPLLYGAVILIGYWLVLFGLYERKLFLRI